VSFLLPQVGFTTIVIRKDQSMLKSKLINQLFYFTGSLMQTLSDQRLGDTNNTDPAVVKFDLYLRLREVRAISAQLEKITRKDDSKRQEFVKENRIFLESLMGLMVQDSNLSLEGIRLDQEAAELSMQLAIDLRQTLAMINHLFYEAKGVRA